MGACYLMTEPAVSAAEWRLTLHDIDSGNGVVCATLRSGAQFTGKVDLQMSGTGMNTLFLRTVEGGYHVIDWTEIAVLTGVPDDSQA
jgi:hypothetical protein